LNWGRTIKVETEVRGNILAPRNTLVQTGGVVKGKVIVGDVPMMLQINRPNCFNYIPIKIIDFVDDSCKPGSDEVKIRNGGGCAEGDNFEFENSPGIKRTIVKKTENSDGTCTLKFSPAVNVLVPQGIRTISFVNANTVTDARTDAAQKGTSASSTLVLSVTLLFAAMIALLA